MIICKRTEKVFESLDEVKAKRGTDLRDLDLRYSDLRNSNFRCSDLRNSNLSDSDLSDSNLSYSNLRRADFRWTNLLGSTLDGTILSKEVLTKEKYEKMIQERLEFLEALKKEQEEDLEDIGCKWCWDFCWICEICPAYDVSMKVNCLYNRLCKTRKKIRDTLPNASDKDIDKHIKNFKEISEAFMKDRFKERDFIDLSEVEYK